MANRVGQRAGSKAWPMRVPQAGVVATMAAVSERLQQALEAGD